MAARETPKRDYYEVLEVADTATDDELKRAYRRLALIWHPDKNLHRVDEAHERFKAIQNAYTVLSDSNERSWYDAHKDAILGRGEAGESPVTNLFAFFSGNAFEGYDDGPKGFYTVYRELFVRVCAEEKRYAGEKVKSSEWDLPSFGNAATPVEELIAFYDFWGSYTSRMSFAWVDEHNPLEAPNRFVRRAMEKENKKLQDAARRERSEEIRALVNYVKRRDRRYISGMAEMRRNMDEAAAARRKAAEERARAHAAQAAQRAAELAATTEEYHAEMRAMSGYRLADDQAAQERARKRAQRAVARATGADEGDEVAAADGGDDDDADGVGGDAELPASGAPRVVRYDAVAAAMHQDSSEEDEDSSQDDVYVCEPCNKEFRSAAAMENHERSKKHIAALNAWKDRAAASRAAPRASDEEDEEGSEAVADEDGVPDVSALSVADDDKANKNGDAASAHSHTPSSGASSDDEFPGLAYVLAKSASKTTARHDAKASSHEISDSDDDDDIDLAALHPGKLSSKPRAESPVQEDVGEEDEGGRAGEDGAGAATASADMTDGPSEADKKAPEVKKKRRRADKAAKAEAGKTATTSGAAGSAAAGFRVVMDPAALAGGSRGVPMAARANAAAVSQVLAETAAVRCDVCGQVFGGRNKLFAHIRKTGHASLKEVSPHGAAAAAGREVGDGEDVRGRRGKRR